MCIASETIVFSCYRLFPVALVPNGFMSSSHPTLSNISFTRYRTFYEECVFGTIKFGDGESSAPENSESAVLGT